MPELEILRCPTCNAPVPLGGGDDVACPYCGASFPVPEKHRALRDAERRRASERDEARALYDTLGHPPGALARAWGQVATGCVWLFLWPIGFAVDALLIAKGLEVLSRSVGASLFEVLPGPVVWGGVGVVLYVTLAIPIAIGVYGNRRTKGRQQLQAALAALPPDREGGPVRCHSCGAPLDVGPGDLGLACLYCGADNLVRMPEAWVANLRAKVGTLDRTIESAGREDREMRAKERKSLRWQLAWPLVFIPLLVGFGFVTDRDAEAYPPAWSTAIAGERRMIPAEKGTARTYEPPALPASGARIRFAFDGAERKKTERGDVYFERRYYLPLRAGERVTFVAGDFPEGARALGFSFNAQASAVFGDDWRQIGKTVYLYPNKTATFDAPQSSWYRVDVMMIDDVAPGRQFDLGLSIEKIQ